jgi:hypothetical protein
MEPETPVGENLTLATVRSRGLQYLNYLFWVLSAAGLLVVLNLTASLLQRWVGFLEWLRGVFAIPRPSGPDLWMLAGFGAALAVIGIVFIAAYSAYRRAWTSRLLVVWRNGYRRIDTRVLRLSPRAGDRDIAQRQRYLDNLRASSDWTGLDPAPSASGPRDVYTASAGQFLKRIEIDIAHRAVTAGLVVGLNRNAVLDAFSIVAAALELQLHVLSRLGKRPSLRLWMELFKRTGGSLFLNWYVSREDALYLKLAIKKTAWGMSAASDLAQQAADALDDMDWHEVLGGAGGIPGLHLVGSLTAGGLGIGAFGLRHLGSFIESTSDDLLQGVLAAGVLYYHGMALAAECLALDLEHRCSPAMNRTISQAMGIALAPAAALLRDQVRLLRQFLRERRRLAFSAVKDNVAATAGSAIDKTRSMSAALWETIVNASRRKPRDAGTG